MASTTWRLVEHLFSTFGVSQAMLSLVAAHSPTDFREDISDGAVAARVRVVRSLFHTISKPGMAVQVLTYSLQYLTVPMIITTSSYSTQTPFVPPPFRFIPFCSLGIRKHARVLC